MSTFTNDTGKHYDCYGLEIKIGDVLASGHRQGITVGIVRGFTEAKEDAYGRMQSSILIDKLHDYEEWEYEPAFPKTRKARQGRKLVKSFLRVGEYCYITGQQEVDILALCYEEKL